MSTKYITSAEVPLTTLIKRLGEIARVVIDGKGKEPLEEFTEEEKR